MPGFGVQQAAIPHSEDKQKACERVRRKHAGVGYSTGGNTTYRRYSRW